MGTGWYRIPRTKAMAAMVIGGDLSMKNGDRKNQLNDRWPCNGGVPKYIKILYDKTNIRYNYGD